MSYSYFFNNGNVLQNGQAKYLNNQILINHQDCSGKFIIIPNGNAEINFSSINNFSQFGIISSSLSNNVGTIPAPNFGWD